MESGCFDYIHNSVCISAGGFSSPNTFSVGLTQAVPALWRGRTLHIGRIYSELL